MNIIIVRQKTFSPSCSLILFSYRQSMF